MDRLEPNPPNLQAPTSLGRFSPDRTDLTPLNSPTTHLKKHKQKYSFLNQLFPADICLKSITQIHQTYDSTLLSFLQNKSSHIQIFFNQETHS